MNAKIARDLEKLIAATLAPYKVEAVRLEGSTDQDGDETLDVMIALEEGTIKKAGTKGFLAVTHAMRAYLIDHGDVRFPHVRFVTPAFFESA